MVWVEVPPQHLWRVGVACTEPPIAYHLPGDRIGGVVKLGRGVAKLSRGEWSTK